MFKYQWEKEKGCSVPPLGNFISKIKKPNPHWQSAAKRQSIQFKNQTAKTQKWVYLCWHY
jgi:hypothetical protein